MKIDLKNRQQLLVLLAGAAVGLFLADKVLLTPLGKAWKAREERIAALSKQVSGGRNLVARERSLRERWAQMQSHTLSNNTSQAEQQILRAFDRWSQASRLGLLSISPQLKHEADEYATLECRVEAAGNLDAISRFLYELERDPMAIKLQGIEVTSRDTDGQQLALGLQVSGLILNPPDTSGSPASSRAR